jgi:hypothetical protein
MSTNKIPQVVFDFSDQLADAVAYRDDIVSISVKDALKLEKILQVKKGVKKPRIFIHVEGGVIQDIISDTKLDVMVLDADVEGMDGYKEYKDMDDDTFNAREAWGKVDVNKKVVDHYFKQR